ncbi:hypothetical protein BJX64DRAFT_285496 [Aspergillus heterothallicus]
MYRHRPEIPERISSLLSNSRCDQLVTQKQRSVSAQSKLSQISQKSSETTVTEFLEAKAESLQAELELIKCHKAAFEEVREKQDITDSEFVESIEPYLSNFRATFQELHVSKRQGRTFHADLEDEYVKKRHRSSEPSNTGLLERAYQSDVIKFYCPAASEDMAWCHIMGKWHHKVKAAHIVPKLLTGNELAHLFGDEESVFDDKRNGITLHSTLEQRLDQGVIVIVPLDEKISAPTRWKCVVLDDTKLDEIISQPPEDQAFKLRDFDGKELRFLTDNRPARRFLYFRFIISYLHAKRNGSLAIQKKVDTKRFWPTMGRYLNNSTLVTLARCVSGCDLPASLVNGQTFESEDEVASEDAGLLLSVKLRDAWTDSVKELSEQRDTGEEEEEEDDTASEIADGMDEDDEL